MWLKTERRVSSGVYDGRLGCSPPVFFRAKASPIRSKSNPLVFRGLNLSLEADSISSQRVNIRDGKPGNAYQQTKNSRSS